jgi:hypothetical protein
MELACRDSYSRVRYAGRCCLSGRLRNASGSRVSCGAGMRARDYTQSSRACNGKDAINATGEEIDGNVRLADEIRDNGLLDSSERSTSGNATGQRSPGPLN